MTAEPLIFLSYASPDRDRVKQYFDTLVSAGLNVWMDQYSIKGGQKWEYQIDKALREACIIIIFISRTSVDKRGFVQKEIKKALDFADEKLDEDIYLLPVILDEDVQIPSQISHIHVVTDDFANQSRSILSSIFDQYRRLGFSQSIAKVDEDINWRTDRVTETWDGLPGYEVSYDRAHLSSNTYQNTTEINDVINGWILSCVHRERRTKFEQSPEIFNFGQMKERRTNWWQANFKEAIVTGTTLSVLYDVYWYGAGAAHPNSHFANFCFSLDPLIRLEKLEEMFSDPDSALTFIQSQIRHNIEHSGVSEGREFSTEWLIEGTNSWDCLQSFLFTANGIKILFPSYQISCYADGPQEYVISYELIVSYLKRDFQDLLGISFLRYA